MHQKPSNSQLLILKERFLELRPIRETDQTLDRLKRLKPVEGPLLSELFPKIREHWLFEFNHGFDPDAFTQGANWLAWWICLEGPDHVYMQTIATHVRSLLADSRHNGCAFCAGRYPSVTNNLAVMFPEIAKEWCYERNRGMKPEDFSYGANAKLWWTCKTCKKPWKSTIANRTTVKSGCPKCNLGESTDLRDFPIAMEQFDHELNPRIDPHAIPRGQKAHWRCTKDESHRWYSGFYRTNKGERCPYCRGILASSTNNLGVRKDLVQQLHPTKNERLKPKEISLTSSRLLWWKCWRGTDHEWQAPVNKRAKKDGSCPFCIDQRLSITNSLATLRPDIAGQWHPTKNGRETPDDVMASTRKRYWWKCKVGPDHVWQATVHSRTVLQYGCPYCSNKKLSVTNSLATYPEVAADFDFERNKPHTPETVIAASAKSFWWICQHCDYEWKARARQRTVMGWRCRNCRKLERSQQSKLPEQPRNAEASLHAEQAQHAQQMAVQHA